MYQNHPYAWSMLGTETSVAQLSRADLHHYHQTYFRPDNIVISLVGRISPEDAIALVNQVFGDWQAPEIPLPTLALPLLKPAPEQRILTQETQQSVIMLGYLATSVRNTGLDAIQQNPSDYAALKLLNTYLGNGLSSRLFVELREKRGLAYEVSAFYPTRLDASQFVVYMGTAPENTAIAYEGLKREVDRLCSTPLRPEELQACKNKLLGQYALGKQTNSQIAQVLGWYETIGLGTEYDTQFQTEVAAIAAETAQAVAKTYFTEPYVSVVGPEAAVKQLAVPAIL
jgi:predicted Zn-dependent peptidase